MSTEKSTVKAIAIIILTVTTAMFLEFLTPRDGWNMKMNLAYIGIISCISIFGGLIIATIIVNDINRNQK